jgi:dipeptidyl aminopeptidase/acylaminoacyl peptidase
LYGRWLPDGRIICDGNETGHPERTYLVDMNGNEKPLTPEGILARAVTTDGKNLIVSDFDSTQFQLFPVDGGQPRPLPQLQKGDTPQDFSSDDKAILLRRSGKDGAIEIWRLELATGKRTLLRSLSAPGARAVARGLNVVSSRDEKSYAYTYHPAISTEYLVQGIR